MKITESRLRAIIKEAVMNELNLFNRDNSDVKKQSPREDIGYLVYGMGKACKDFLINKAGFTVNEIGKIHDKLDSALWDMGEELISLSQKME